MVLIPSYSTRSMYTVFVLGQAAGINIIERTLSRRVWRMSTSKRALLSNRVGEFQKMRRDVTDKRTNKQTEPGGSKSNKPPIAHLLLPHTHLQTNHQSVTCTLPQCPRMMTGDLKGILKPQGY